MESTEIFGEITTEGGYTRPRPEVGAVWCVNAGDKPRYFTARGYINMIFGWAHANPGRRGLGGVYTDLILGFRPGNYIDFSQYAAIGLQHPKVESYYDIHNADPDFMYILEGIKKSGRLWSPPMIYLYQTSDGRQHLVCLDGATRLSCIGYIRQHNPEAFKRIDIQLFRGNYKQAVSAMSALNMTHARDLSLWEKARHSRWLLETNGFALEAIAEALRSDVAFVKQVLTLTGSQATSALQQALHNGLLKPRKAFEIAALAPDAQQAAIDDLIRAKREKSSRPQDGAVRRRRVTKPDEMSSKLVTTVLRLRQMLKKSGMMAEEPAIADETKKMSTIVENVRRQTILAWEAQNDGHKGVVTDGNSSVS